ncbi:MAG: AurF N-oxygenase family protein [Candidatus Binatia bacterium]
MMETAEAVRPDVAGIVPDEERPLAARRESYSDLVERLSRQSVVKHFDAYADVAWDSEELRIDPEDPRWELDRDEALGATAWYRSQAQPIRARIGLHVIANFMKIGVQFESILKRGLLDFAFRLPNRSTEFRYVYHEVIEEAQHSLMFQEFVNRTGFDIPGLSRFDRLMSRLVIRFGRTFPELFFFFVLGGEDPIDHVQRTALRSGRDLHPLLRRIMQIHVTEEARHLCFARHYLRKNVPQLGAVRRFILSVRTPVILAIMAQMMMQPSRRIIREYGIPKSVIDEAYRKNPRHRQKTLESIAKVRELCEELGLITPLSKRIWYVLGIWRTAPA